MLSTDNEVAVFDVTAPDNENFLVGHKFKILIQRAPNVVFYCQEATLPGISIGNATQPTPFVDVPVPGDKIVFEDFVIEFAVDEDMKNYKEITEWIVETGFPRDFRQYSPKIKSNLTLFILDSNHSPVHLVTFTNAFPVSVSGIHFDTKTSDSNPVYCTVTFKYAFWQVDEVNVDPSLKTIDNF